MKSLRTLVIAMTFTTLILSSGVKSQLAVDWSLDLSSLQPESGIVSDCVKIDGEGNTYITYKDFGIGLIKIRSDKSIAFQTVYPGTERPYELLVGPSGECYVLAGEEINSTFDHFRVLRFEPSGTASWSYSWGNPSASFIKAWGLDFSGNVWLGRGEMVYDAPCLDSTLKAVLMKGTSAGISVVNTYRGSHMNGGAYPWTLTGIIADKQGYARLLISEGAMCYNEDCDEYPPFCFVDQYGDSTTHWSQLTLRTHSPGGSLSVDTVFYESSDPSQHESRTWSITGNRDGDLITTYTYRPDPEVWGWETTVKHKYWTIVLPDRLAGGPTADYNGDIYITTQTVDNSKSSADASAASLAVPTLYKLNGNTGNVIWSHVWWSHHVAVDKENNFYTTDGKVDPDGNLLWSWPDLGYAGSIATFRGIDDQNNHYHFDGALGNKMLYKIVEDLTLIIKDAKGNPMSDTEFELIRVDNDPPFFTEHPLDKVTTDSDGNIKFTPAENGDWEIDISGTVFTFHDGDLLKLTKHLHSEYSLKHESQLGTMYSVHLDNAKFDQSGAMSFYEFGSEDERTLVMDHTELRYNMLVTVEWEATSNYLYGLESNFQMMSNYLYDVTDGQLRLDTVVILDNNQQAGLADMIIYATNGQWPCADAGGMHHLASWAPGGWLSDHISMPRIWMGDSTNTRNHTDNVYPLDLTSPSKDFRTKGHEFGHYALNFFDEYLFWNADSNEYIVDRDGTLRCFPSSNYRYGFMDYQYEGGGVMSSEMSSNFRYDYETCRNTNQWGVNNKSCWDHLESWVEAVNWGQDNIYAPILKPDASDENERIVNTPSVYFPGPNDDLYNLNYDVGAKIIFPNNVNPQALGYSNKHIMVYHSQGGDNAKITLKNDPAVPGNTRTIEQGKTSDNAGLWVIGIKNADYEILASKKKTLGTVVERAGKNNNGIIDEWLFGIASSNGSRASRIDNLYSTNLAGDSITMELREVQGNFPLLFTSALLLEGAEVTIFNSQSFDSIPTIEFESSAESSGTYSMTTISNGYAAQITDSLGSNGSFTLWAYDDSTSLFFVPTNYTQEIFDHDQPYLWFFGPETRSEVKLDSSNLSLERGMILSSSYPVIRTGLAENSVQAGQAHSISVYPENSLTGSNQIIIRYDDADLMIDENIYGDEGDIMAYQWVDAATGWVPVESIVDTVFNEIYATISETGIYAAFTTNIVTDVENDYGEALPYRFNLSQNYPNPFNPVTNIEYSLPKLCHVTIEIYNVMGQRVRTLVDREESAGSYTVTWDGMTAGGKTAATGVYLYRFHAGGHVETRKMLLLK